MTPLCYHMQTVWFSKLALLARVGTALIEEKQPCVIFIILRSKKIQHIVKLRNNINTWWMESGVFLRLNSNRLFGIFQRKIWSIWCRILKIKIITIKKRGEKKWPRSTSLAVKRTRRPRSLPLITEILRSNTKIRPLMPDWKELWKPQWTEPNSQSTSCRRSNFSLLHTEISPKGGRLAVVYFVFLETHLEKSEIIKFAVRLKIHRRPFRIRTA